MRNELRRLLPPRPSGPAARRRLVEAIYGTIVVLSVLEYVQDEHQTAAESAVAVGAGAVVLFFARLYAEAVAERTSEGQMHRELWRLMSEIWPVAAVAAIPFVLLSLASSGLLRLDIAFNVGSAIGLVGLMVCGYAAARLLHESRTRRVLSTISTLAVGVLIIALKATF